MLPTWGWGRTQPGQRSRPIAYFSWKLLPREQNYSVVEQECLAVVLGIKAFETYLLGKPFVIQTDHRALQWLQQFKDKNARLTRWSLALQQYTFTITHCKGRENAKRRRPVTNPTRPVIRKEGGNVTEREVQEAEAGGSLRWIKTKPTN